jgi:hypothetical protein
VSDLGPKGKYRKKEERYVWQFCDIDTQSDSKLLSRFPWSINGNADNNLESFRTSSAHLLSYQFNCTHRRTCLEINTRKTV